MGRYEIRLGHTDSVNSVDKENFLGVQLKSTSKKLHYNDIKTKIDQYEQFNKERAESSKYRMILTINPYCSNVLFNPLTEVFKIDDGKITRYFDNTKNSKGIDGDYTPIRVQMVCNTEYSKETKSDERDRNYGYSYMPGYDIFDNHILRNKGFKIVEPTEQDKDVFNTLADYYRSPDTKAVFFKKRVSLSEKPVSTKQHLYASDDLFTFEESVNANLTDENGWFGFINASTLKTTAPGEDGKQSSISCVINNRKNCEFIDMYPDRTAFTFSPYYNKVVDRLEYNWEVFLTYAYQSDHCNVLVSENGVNGLPVLFVKKDTGVGGEDIYVFRCYTKHNLKRGDSIKVYDVSTETPTKPVGVYRVSNVGNGGKGDPDYYFYIDGYNVADSLTDKVGIRFVKTYNGFDSSYYVRKLKKVKKLNSERYKLAFASTIYDDDTTQITFTDDIDVGELRDNLGRPVTELFVTIVKTNKGNSVWYGTADKINASDVEISHCFGKVTAGFVLGREKSDRYGEVGGYSIQTLLEGMRDVRSINNNNRFMSRRIQIDVTPDDTEFLCDVVEFSPEDCMEHVLSECAYRFNTYQRETSGNDTTPYKPIEKDFTYHEILYDDYDVYGDTKERPFHEAIVTSNELRDEGYYYKANYSIPIRGIGGISQAGNREIRVKTAKPVFNGNIVINVNSSLSSRLNTNDSVYVCDDKNNRMFEFVCTEVRTPTSFCIEPKNDGKWERFKEETSYISGGLTWLNVCQMLTDGLLKLRGRNYDIPDYAFKFGTNTYMWREVILPGQKTDSDVPDYPFTNDAFYLTPIIRFYLKRQDPDDSVGLQARELFPNDVFGNIKKQSNYYYEDEPQDLC